MGIGQDAEQAGLTIRITGLTWILPVNKIKEKFKYFVIQ